MSGRRRRIGRRLRGCSGEGGGTALEMLIIAPGLLLLILGMVAFGRYESSASGVSAAAASAARAATLQPDRVSAEEAAREQVARDLEPMGCSPLSVIVDAAAFDLPLGQPGSVRVDIACTVNLADVAMPGIPGTTTAKASASSPIDIYRER